jgi:D-alanine transaminase
MAPHPTCFLNGSYLPLAEARISPLDRGFLFADSVYEVLPVYFGRPFRFTAHFDRLDRSLGEIGMAPAYPRARWLEVLEGLIERNGGGDMYVYVQVTRGTEFGRNHTFPKATPPTVFAMAATLPADSAVLCEGGITAVTLPDERWARCDIKTTALLANVLAKQQAASAGAQEAILVRDGEVKEGASMSIFALLDGTVVTPPNHPGILPGTTRDVVLELLEGLAPIDIRALRREELASAAEIWLTSATRDAVPVTVLDNRRVGDGRPGPVFRALHERFETLKRELAGTPAMSEPAGLDLT